MSTLRLVVGLVAQTRGAGTVAHRPTVGVFQPNDTEVYKEPGKFSPQVQAQGIESTELNIKGK